MRSACFCNMGLARVCKLIGYGNWLFLSKTIENSISGVVNKWKKRRKALGRKHLGLVNKLVENVDNLLACLLFYALM